MKKSIFLIYTVLILTSFFTLAGITIAQTKKLPANSAPPDKTQVPKITSNCTPEYQAKITQIRVYLEKVKSYQSQEIRGKSTIDLNSLLWECDEQFARSSFSSLWQTLASEIENAKIKKKNTVTNTPDEIKNLNKSLGSNEYLQQYLISRILGLDKLLAKQLSKNLTSQEKGVADYLAIEGNFDPNNPSPQQLNLIRQFLRNNSTIRTVPFLIDLKKRNAQIADQLFVELLSLSQNSSNLSFKNLMELGAYLYASRLFYNTDSSDSTLFAYLPAAPLVIDLTVKRDDADRSLTVPYLNLATRFLLNSVTDPVEKTRRYIFGRILLGHIYSDAPELAYLMQQALQIHFDGVPDKYKEESFYEIFRKINTSSEPDNYEKNLEDLEKTIGSDNRDDKAARLASVLYNKGQYERIEKVAAYISDVDKRNSILDVVIYTKAQKLIDNNKIEETELILKKATDPTIKALIGFRLLQNSKIAKNATTNLPEQFTYDVINDTKKSDSEYTPLLLFALAKMVYKHDEGLGYELTGAAVKKLNSKESWSDPRWRLEIPTPTLGIYPSGFSMKKIQGLRIPESLNFLIKESKTNLEEVLLGIKNETIHAEAILLLAKQHLAEARNNSASPKDNTK
jgi:hypothetical protein